MTSSTWDYKTVRRRLAQRMFHEINPEAYAIDDVGFPKDGLDSPGVARLTPCVVGAAIPAAGDREIWDHGCVRA